MTRSRLAPLATLAAALLTTAPLAAHAGTPLPPQYVEECGACHVAYPARMLDAASWNAVLAGLPEHFGVDATLGDEALAALRAYLEPGARRKPTSADGQPQLRITETRWFRHEHDEVPSRLRRGPDAVEPSDCGACHREAATGSYAERSLRMPKKGASK